MVLRDIAQIIETWAPKEIAWDKDNVGLQIGNPNKTIKKILVTLDVTDKIIIEAHANKIDLIISHHPLIFTPIEKINTNRTIDNLISLLIKNDIAIYSAHTNLDFIKDGVSFTLAKKLGLKNLNFLLNNHQIDKKIAVFVPVDYIDKVRKAMAEAGAGIIGTYKECSFGSLGTGTFRPSIGSKPYIGHIGKFEKVQETKLEMIVPSWKLGDVLTAMRATHPYEAIAYDIYNLENKSQEFGMGAIGEFKDSMQTKKFFRHICRRLNIPVLRFSGKMKKLVKRVAVCGGSGSQLIETAYNKGADAIITGDISYHKFSNFNGDILIIDAGHYETEFLIVDEIVRKLQLELQKKKSNIQVIKSKFLKNTINYFIS